MVTFFTVTTAQQKRPTDLDHTIRAPIEHNIEFQNLTANANDKVANEFQNDTIVSIIEDVKDEHIISYFYEPYPLEIGASVFQIGGSASMLPLPIAEQEVPYPSIDIQYKRGLFENVSFVASWSSFIYISNLVHCGLQWNIHSDAFSFALANHAGGLVGFTPEDENFDKVSAYALIDMPIVRFGYRFDDFSLSMSFAVTYCFKAVSFINGKKAAAGPDKSFNDFFCTIAVEQPFLKNAHVLVGFSLGFAKTPYQSWMLFNTLEQWLFVPEFFFAVQL